MKFTQDHIYSSFSKYRSIGRTHDYNKLLKAFLEEVNRLGNSYNYPVHFGVIWKLFRVAFVDFMALYTIPDGQTTDIFYTKRKYGRIRQLDMETEIEFVMLIEAFQYDIYDYLVSKISEMTIAEMKQFVLDFLESYREYYDRLFSNSLRRVSIKKMITIFDNSKSDKMR